MEEVPKENREPLCPIPVPTPTPVPLSREPLPAAGCCVAWSRRLQKGRQTLQPQREAVPCSAFPFRLPSGLQCPGPAPPVLLSFGVVRGVP